MIVLIAVLVLLVGGGLGFAAGHASAPGPLDAPRALSPAEGQTFDIFPRDTTVTWSPVDGATSYRVEVEGAEPGGSSWFALPAKGGEVAAPATEWRFSFVGAQPGRWRVSAVEDGHLGPPSAWSTFVYQQ